MREPSCLFQSHVLVSLIGDAFQASKMEEDVQGGRDLIVEALRHKVGLTLQDLFKFGPQISFLFIALAKVTHVI